MKLFQRILDSSNPKSVDIESKMSLRTLDDSCNYNWGKREYKMGEKLQYVTAESKREVIDSEL